MDRRPIDREAVTWIGELYHALADRAVQDTNLAVAAAKAGDAEAATYHVGTVAGFLEAMRIATRLEAKLLGVPVPEPPA